MKIARISGGTVVNLEEWAERPTDTAEYLFREAGGAGIGWVWDGQGFVDPAPPTPERRLIAKSLVQDRLITAGKLSAVLAVLKTDDAAYVRWFAPDHPNVYFDDTAMLQVLTYVGADIPTITAP